MISENTINMSPTPTVSEDELSTQSSYAVPSAVVTCPADATTVDQMNIIEASGVLAFWDDPEEDRYDGTEGHTS
ncbi:MAG: hypothetical protein J5J06_05145 [Phycisphaerae bacterium]|nr:hypothetical protein [Phycisphaerae bacterium]